MRHHIQHQLIEATIQFKFVVSVDVLEKVAVLFRKFLSLRVFDPVFEEKNLLWRKLFGHMVNDFDAFGLHQLLQLFHNIFRCLFKNSQNTIEVHILASKVVCFQQRGKLIGELHYKVALVTLGTFYSVLLLRCSLQAVKK